MLKKAAWNRRLVRALWFATAYLLVVYAAMRWGHSSSPPRFPGSD